MDYSKSNEIKRLNFEDILAIIFIVLSILTIISNKLQKEFLENNNKEIEKKVKEMNIFILFLTIFIYAYFVQRNYSFLKNPKNNESTSLLTYRFIGSVLLVIGVSFILYYQIKTPSPLDSAEI